MFGYTFQLATVNYGEWKAFYSTKAWCYFSSHWKTKITKLPPINTLLTHPNQSLYTHFSALPSLLSETCHCLCSSIVALVLLFLWSCRLAIFCSPLPTTARSPPCPCRARRVVVCSEVWYPIYIPCFFFLSALNSLFSIFIPQSQSQSVPSSIFSPFALHQFMIMFLRGY